MNLPTQARDVHRALADAFNTGRLETVLSIYDVNGTIVPEPGKVISEPEDFTAAVKSILAIKGKMEIRTVYCLEYGDIAVGRSEWSIRDGEELKIAAKGIELLKRQDDGTWKVVVDHAFGADAGLMAV